MNTNIQIDKGLRIDDRWAAALVTKMLGELHQRVNSLTTAVGDVRNNRSSVGNPIGQKRFFDRIIEKQRFGLLAASVTYGNRCKFRAIFDLWDATAAGEDAKGPLSWLSSIRVDVRGNGPGRIDNNMNELVAISRHALERMVQRGQVRTANAFIGVLKRAWAPLSLVLSTLVTAPDALSEGTTWVLPIDLPPDGGTVYLLVTRNTAARGPHLIVTTAYTEDMIVSPQALVPIKDLLKSYEGASDFSPLTTDPRLVPALMETVHATRRGRRI